MTKISRECFDRNVIYSKFAPWLKFSLKKKEEKIHSEVRFKYHIKGMYICDRNPSKSKYASFILFII